MNEQRNPRLTANAQTLRKTMTKEERHLWYDFLKGLSVPVKRQKVIGPYIVDFCIPSANLIIELDGSQHFEESGLQADQIRDAYFYQWGYTILRYSNADVNYHFRDVCEDILRRISSVYPTDSP